MKKIIKLITSVVFTMIISYLIFDNFYLIKNKLEYLYKKYLQPEIRQTLIDNDYRKKQNYEYVKIYDSFVVKNKEDIKNSIYTFLDGGWPKYTFQCDPDYLKCIDDASSIIDDQIYLTELSDFVHPYNTFEQINTTYSSTGRITLKKISKYSDEKIKLINKKVDEIYNKYYDKNKNTKDNIKIFHDYIINNTKYDVNNPTGSNKYSSSNAYGVLYEGIGVCSGYSDAMQLFLEKMNVKNYRISSDDHIWNLVYVEGKWKHLDLTWDDPISTSGKDRLEYNYFLIDNDRLNILNDKEHKFNHNIYLETK